MSQPTALRDWTGYDRVGQMMAYEDNKISGPEIVRLFQHLVDTDMVWRLQGHYGRVAHLLIGMGLVAPEPHLAPSHPENRGSLCTC